MIEPAHIAPRSSGYRPDGLPGWDTCQKDWQTRSACQSRTSSRSWCEQETQYFLGSSAVPVSSSDLRLDRICGHPPDTAAMNFESARSMLWVTVNFTASPLGSISMVQSDQPSAFSSGLNSLRQRMASRLGGSNSTIS